MKKFMQAVFTVILLTPMLASAAYMEDGKVRFAMLSGYITEKIVAPEGKYKLAGIEFPTMNMSGSYSLTVANMGQEILYKTPDDDVLWQDEGIVSVDLNITVSSQEALMVLVMYIPDDSITSFWVPVTPGGPDDEIGYNNLFDYPPISEMGYTAFTPIWSEGEPPCLSPSFIKGSNLENTEDSLFQVVPGWATAITAPGNEPQILTFHVTTSDTDLFAKAPEIDASTGNLSYTLADDAYGAVAITVILKGEGVNECGNENASAPHIFTITVNPVNDAPSFLKGPDQVVNPKLGIRVVSGWATGISAGPENESHQNLTFHVTTDNDPLFSQQPEINPETGDLTYTLAENVQGTARVTVTLKDSGGTENNGADMSESQTFQITATDGPVPEICFAKDPDQTVDEDAGSQTVSGWATEIGACSGSGLWENLIFHVVTDNDALFATSPEIDAATGDLTYSLAPDAYGTATLTVTLQDEGGTVTSDPQTVTITVISVNDAPGFAKGPDQKVSNPSGSQIVPGWATDISAGPGNESDQTLTFQVITDNDALFATDPEINAITGDLTYSPAKDISGAANVRVTLRDDGGFENGGLDISDPQTFRITVGISGDADDNGIVELRDVVIMLQVLTGIVPNDICLGADVNSDGKIGMEEVVFALEEVRK